jgi:Arc/MetJ family transcription regulator
MRTNIVIDDELLAEAQRLTGHRTKRATVEEALRLLVQARRGEPAIRELRGKVKWVGNLKESRLGREFAVDRRR